MASVCAVMIKLPDGWPKGVPDQRYICCVCKKVEWALADNAFKLWYSGTNTPEIMMCEPCYHISKALKPPPL